MSEHRQPSLCYPLQVAGVNRFLPSSSDLKRKAGVIVPSLVPEFTRAIRHGAPGDRRHGIDDRGSLSSDFFSSSRASR